MCVYYSVQLLYYMLTYPLMCSVMWVMQLQHISRVGIISVTVSMDHYWSSQRRNHNHRKYILYLNTVIKKAEWNKLLWWSKHFHYPVSPARSDNWWKKKPKCMYFTEAVYLWLLIMLRVLWKVCAEGADRWSAWTIPLGSISLSHNMSKQIVPLV